MAQPSPFPLTNDLTSYRAGLRSWLASLTKPERRYFGETMGFKCLFGWTGMRVDWTMLRAVSRFWSIETHLFHFSYNEMCPSFEEFCAMTGMPDGRTIATPSFIRSPTQALEELLGLPRAECRAMIRGTAETGRYVDLTGLPALFAKPNSDNRDGALALCLFARYFFVCYEGMIAARAVDIVLQAMGGLLNIIPIILAETLHGLDCFSAGISHFGSGSPMLLHMWVQEHFKLIPPPMNGLFNPAQYAARGRYSTNPSDENSWISLFAQAITSEIAWIVPQWGIQHFVPQSQGYAVVVLPGLYESSFYWATRIFRQFGWEQIIPHIEEPVLPNSTLDGSMARHIQALWYHNAEERTVAARDPPLTVLLSQEYLEWIGPKTEDQGTEILTMVEAYTGLSLASGMISRLWEIGINPEEQTAPRSKKKGLSIREAPGSHSGSGGGGRSGRRRGHDGGGSSSGGSVFSRLG